MQVLAFDTQINSALMFVNSESLVALLHCDILIQIGCRPSCGLQDTYF